MPPPHSVANSVPRGKRTQRGADDNVAGLSDDDRERLRVDGVLRLETVGEPAAVVAPDRLLHRRDPVEVGSLAHLAQPTPSGRRGSPATASTGAITHRLRLLGHEARGEQPLREIRRLVVCVQLPLEPLAALGEHAHLARDQLVELCAFEPAEVAVVDEPAVLLADDTQQRAVLLDVHALRQPVGQPAAELRVVGRGAARATRCATSGAR